MTGSPLKVAVLMRYGGLRCIQCGEDRLKLLTLSHVGPRTSAEQAEWARIRRLNPEAQLTGIKFYRWIVKNGYPWLPVVTECMNHNMVRSP